jgi:N-acetylmuramoyl-L-alanine amidase
MDGDHFGGRPAFRMQWWRTLEVAGTAEYPFGGRHETIAQSNSTLAAASTPELIASNGRVVAISAGHGGPRNTGVAHHDNVDLVREGSQP